MLGDRTNQLPPALGIASLKRSQGPFASTIYRPKWWFFPIRDVNVYQIVFRKIYNVNKPTGPYNNNYTIPSALQSNKHHWETLHWAHHDAFTSFTHLVILVSRLRLWLVNALHIRTDSTPSTCLKTLGRRLVKLSKKLPTKTCHMWKNPLKHVIQQRNMGNYIYIYNYILWYIYIYQSWLK